MATDKMGQQRTLAHDRDLTPADMLARTRELVPWLREEQQATEELGHYAPELHVAIGQAGLYRMLRPRRSGGFEVDLATYLKAIELVASGCPSTGWSVAAATAHVLSVASLFPEVVQAEVFDEAEEVLVCAGRTSVGSAERVDDGWRIQGVWEYCDGVPYASWMLARVLLPPHDTTGGSGRIGTALVPRSQFEVLGDWRDVLGLRGSGSHSIRIDTVVPEGSVVGEDFCSLAHRSSAAPLGSPLYNSGSASLIAAVLAATAVGVGQGALEWYDDMVRTRKTFFPPQILRYEDINYQRHYGLAVGMVESAASVVVMAGNQHVESSGRPLESDEAASAEDELRLISRYQQAFLLCWQAVRLMFVTGGSSAASRNSTMGRYFRDLSTLRTRADLQHDAYARDLSRHHFDLTEAIAP